jgi:hypothetical protein
LHSIASTDRENDQTIRASLDAPLHGILRNMGPTNEFAHHPIDAFQDGIPEAASHLRDDTEKAARSFRAVPTVWDSNHQAESCRKAAISFYAESPITGSISAPAIRQNGRRKREKEVGSCSAMPECRVDPLYWLVWIAPTPIFVLLARRALQRSSSRSEYKFICAEVEGAVAL